MSEYQVQNTRVFGNGKSFNCLNKVTANELCNLLNTYEKTSVEYHQIEDKLDKVQRTIISLQMSVSIISDELEKIHQEVIQ